MLLLNSSKKEIDSKFNELQIREKDLNDEYLKLATITAYQYFKNNFENDEISINIEMEDYEYYLSFSLITEEDTYGMPLDEITEKIYLPKKSLEDIYTRNEHLSFLNNELGRNSLFKLFLGNDGLEWKKENEIIIHKNLLTNNLHEKDVEKKLPKTKI